MSNLFIDEPFYIFNSEYVEPGDYGCLLDSCSASGLHDIADIECEPSRAGLQEAQHHLPHDNVLKSEPSVSENVFASFESLFAQCPSQTFSPNTNNDSALANAQEEHRPIQIRTTRTVNKPQTVNFLLKKKISETCLNLPPRSGMNASPSSSSFGTSQAMVSDPDTNSSSKSQIESLQTNATVAVKDNTKNYTVLQERPGYGAASPVSSEAESLIPAHMSSPVKVVSEFDLSCESEDNFLDPLESSVALSFASSGDQEGLSWESFHDSSLAVAVLDDAEAKAPSIRFLDDLIHTMSEESEPPSLLKAAMPAPVVEVELVLTPAPAPAPAPSSSAEHCPGAESGVTAFASSVRQLDSYAVDSVDVTSMPPSSGWVDLPTGIQRSASSSSQASRGSSSPSSETMDFEEFTGHNGKGNGNGSSAQAPPRPAVSGSPAPNSSNTIISNSNTTSSSPENSCGSSRRDTRASGPGTGAVSSPVTSSVNKRKAPDVDLDSITDVKEVRRQRRMAKNRVTAARSREKKKSQWMEMEASLKEFRALVEDLTRKLSASEEERAALREQIHRIQAGSAGRQPASGASCALDPASCLAGSYRHQDAATGDLVGSAGHRGGLGPCGGSGAAKTEGLSSPAIAGLPFLSNYAPSAVSGQRMFSAPGRMSGGGLPLPMTIPMRLPLPLPLPMALGMGTDMDVDTECPSIHADGTVSCVAPGGGRSPPPTLMSYLKGSHNEPAALYLVIATLLLVGCFLQADKSLSAASAGAAMTFTCSIPSLLLMLTHSLRRQRRQARLRHLLDIQSSKRQKHHHQQELPRQHQGMVQVQMIPGFSSSVGAALNPMHSGSSQIHPIMNCITSQRILSSGSGSSSSSNNQRNNHNFSDSTASAATPVMSMPYSSSTLMQATTTTTTTPSSPPHPFAAGRSGTSLSMPPPATAPPPAARVLHRASSSTVLGELPMSMSVSLSDDNDDEQSSNSGEQDDHDVMSTVCVTEEEEGDVMVDDALSSPSGMQIFEALFCLLVSLRFLFSTEGQRSAASSGSCPPSPGIDMSSRDAVSREHGGFKDADLTSPAARAPSGALAAVERLVANFIFGRKFGDGVVKERLPSSASLSSVAAADGTRPRRSGRATPPLKCGGCRGLAFSPARNSLVCI